MGKRFITPLLAQVSKAEEYLPERRSYLDLDQYMIRKRELVADNITFVEGTDSLFLVSSRHKYIRKDACTYWPNPDGELVLMTPGEVARLELKREFGDYKTFYKKEDFDRQKKLLDIPPPYFWDGIPIKDKPLYYLDIKAAYWQVYQWLTLDMVWPCGMGQRHFYPLAQRLAEFKLARNSVIGITRANRMTLWKSGEPVEHGFINHYYNPAIWQAVQSVMHEIAWTAKCHGACYIAVDGYIFTSPMDFGWFQAYLDDKGFTYETQKGEGYILGWSAYKVGEKKTHGKSKGILPGPDTVQFKKGYVEWLLKIKKRYLSRSITDVQ